MSYRHTITVLTTKEDADTVRDAIVEALYDIDGYATDQDVTVIKSELAVNKERLVGLVVWAAGERAKQDLGLPSEWNQEHWLSRGPDLSCGTACCIAGKVVVEDGGVAVWSDDRPFTGRAIIDGQQVRVEEYAANALGLTYEEGARLFKDRNTLADITRIVGEYVNEPAQTVDA